MAHDSLKQTIDFIEQGYEAGWTGAIAAALTIMEREKMSAKVMREIADLPVKMPDLIKKMREALQ